MPRVKIRSVLPGLKSIDPEIARLRDLSVGELRARWHTMFKRRAPAQLPRHLLFRTIAYRLQANQFGDLSRTSLMCSTGRPRRMPRDEKPSPVNARTLMSARGRSWAVNGKAECNG